VALLEPTNVPGVDKALLELFAFFTVVIVLDLVLMVGSIVRVIRAVRRWRRGGRSVGAVGLAALATAIAAAWLLYWIAYDLRDHSSPINGLLAINFAICLPPLTWLVAAMRANRSQRR
jgi:hypothetical protein